MKENILLKKSYDFSLNVLQMCWEVQKQKKEYDLTRQLIRSSTSVGANSEEGVGGYSRKDFSAKLGIAYKEARESRFWLRLMRDSGLVDRKITDPFITEADELAKILFTIIRTTKKSKFPIDN
ncbi:MAG: four helix bundle protein [Crocinitomicaceae bacterium]|nr:four helix bundle protein [Crocinitomicaceae bacterium]